MKTYILVGDIRHAGRVSVVAASEEDAIAKAESGDFAVVDEMSDYLAFEFCGDWDAIEIEADDANPAAAASTKPETGWSS